MTIQSRDILQALSQRPAIEPAISDNNPTSNSGRFASHLQQAFASEPATVPKLSQPQAIAELLNLQMLQSTLSLSGVNDPQGTTASPPFSRINELLASYTANLSESAKAAQPVIPPTDSIKNVSESQLHDLAGAVPDTASAENGKISPAPPERLDRIIAAASQRYGVDAGLIKAVIKAESNFNPQAVSHAGAKGLMQLMPGTARALGVSDSFDPEQNVMGGTRFLRDMLKRYDGNIDSALAAYNWGPGNVDKRPASLPRETREYQARVKQLYAMYAA